MNARSISFFTPESSRNLHAKPCSTLHHNLAHQNLLPNKLEFGAAIAAAAYAIMLAEEGYLNEKKPVDELGRSPKIVSDLLSQYESLEFLLHCDSPVSLTAETSVSKPLSFVT